MLQAHLRLFPKRRPGDEFFFVAKIGRQDWEPLERREIIGNYRPILRRRTFYTCIRILINVKLSLNAENVNTSL